MNTDSPSPSLAALVREGCGAVGAAPGQRAVEQCLLYIRELRRWNEKINLTGCRTDREIVGKLLADSLAWTGAAEQDTDTPCAVLDVGSGAGFPGIPIAIVCPHHAMTLLEPNLKKVAFLHHLVGLLGLTQVRVEAKSVEAFSRQRDVHGTFDWVLMKALRLSAGLPYVRPLLAASGQCAVWRTRSVTADLRSREFSVVRETAYELPFGFGPRLLSIVKRRHGEDGEDEEGGLFHVEHGGTP